MKRQLILVTAPWCQPCMAFKPIYEEVSKEYPEIEFDYCDIGVSENMRFARRNGVASVPALIYLENEIKVADKLEPTNADHIRKLLSENVSITL